MQRDDSEVGSLQTGLHGCPEAGEGCCDGMGGVCWGCCAEGWVMGWECVGVEFVEADAGFGRGRGWCGLCGHRGGDDVIAILVGNGGNTDELRAVVAL